MIAERSIIWPYWLLIFSSLLRIGTTIPTLVVPKTSAKKRSYWRKSTINNDSPSVPKKIKKGIANCFIPLSSKISSSISNPERNIKRKNPRIANPEINSEEVTNPKTGPIKRP